MKRLTAAAFAAMTCLTLATTAHAQFAHEDYYRRESDPHYGRPVVLHPGPLPFQRCMDQQRHWNHMSYDRAYYRCKNLAR